jgi:hypothetical protein
MKISIRVGDIEFGVRGSVECCPVALASRRAMPGAAEIWVGHFICFRDEAGHESRMRLPAEALAFIRAFDAGETVPPIAFEAEPVEEVR